MKEIRKLVQKIFSYLIIIMIIAGCLPCNVQAGTTYTLHAVDDLSNSDALYRDYVKAQNLYFGYITNLSSPVWKVFHSDFKTVTSGSRTFLYTSPKKIPTKEGRANASAWSDVASVTYKDAGYYGSDKNNKFDIVFTLEKVVSMKPVAATEVLTTAPYYTVALTDNSTGNLHTESYVRDSNLIKTENNTGPYTIENWNIKIFDKGGNVLSRVLVAQTYRDLDVSHLSNDSSYPSFNEGFCFVSGFADDTYVTKTSTVKVYDMFGKTKSRYESGRELGNTMNDGDQDGWVISAISGGNAVLQWSGQSCNSIIAQTVFRDYPNLPDPVKAVNADIVKANQEIEYTVTENFPIINPSNCARAITFTDTIDDHLTVLPDVKITCEGQDVTDAWTVKADGQKIAAIANDPGTVEGAYTFTIRAIVKNESLDSKTLIIKEGATYAEIPNTAHITVKDQYDKNIERDTKPVKVLEKGASISVTKDVDKTHIDSPEEGDQLKYSFSIKNTGKLTLHDITLDDALPVKDLTFNWDSSSDKATGKGTLSPGETVTASCIYELKADDISTGQVKNTVTVQGKDPKDQIVKAKDTAETTISAKPGISLSKTADPNKMTDPKAGDKITYHFVISNTGSLPLHAISFTDDHELTNLTWSAEDMAKTTLPAGGKIEGQADYILKQSDIDAGQVLNKADVNAVGSNDEKVKDHAEDTTVIDTTPAIQLKKSTPESVLTAVRAGDPVSFDFAITNTGNNTLSKVYIEDHLEGISSISYRWNESSDAATAEGILSPGETVSASATYNLTEQDIVAKAIVNTATAHGTDPSGREVTSDANAKVQIKYNPSVKIEKTANIENYTGAKAGDIITYTLSLTNDGNVDLVNVELADLKEGVVVTEYKWPEKEGFLAPGQTVTAIAEYTLTQDDIDVTQLENEAEGRGQAPDGRWVEDKTPATITKEMNPGIALVKDVDINEIASAKAGDTLTYTITVTNIGDVTLHDIDFEDSLEKSLYDMKVVRNAPTTPVDPIEDMSDVDNSETSSDTGAEVESSETAAGTEAEEDNPEAASGTKEEMETIEITSSTEEGAENTAASNAAENTQAENNSEYTAEGIVPGDLTEVSATGSSLEDTHNEMNLQFLSASTSTTENSVVNTKSAYMKKENQAAEYIMNQIGAIAADVSALAPNESFTVTAKYNVTQDDINNGCVTNEASVTARDPNGNEVTARDDAQTILIRKASDAVTKKASVSKVSSQDAKAGYEIKYEFTASNTGNTTLHDVEFTDEMLKKSGNTITWNWNTEGVLLPGETITGSAVYKLTQEDIKTGSLLNTVIMEAKAPDGTPLPPAEAKTETILEKKADHTVTKTADKDSIDKPNIGDVIKYVFTYTNTGNVELCDIKFTDEKIAKAGGEIDWDWSSTKSGGSSGVLLPGESITGKTAYKITQADIDAGKVTNAIIANAKDPKGNPLDPAKSEVSTRISQITKISVKKSVDKTSLVDPAAGTVLTFLFKITNEGTTTLYDVTLSDTLTGHGLSDITYQYPDEKNVLLPGQSMNASAAYKLTAADITARRVQNIVYARAKDPQKNEITSEKATATTTITVTVRPTNTPTPIPAVRYASSTQTATSPKTGDRTEGLFIAAAVLVAGIGLLIGLIRKYRIRMR